MSKEQTPITAEEYLNKEGIEECCDYLPPSKIAPLMEQYAQAKVLEALEREFSKVDISMFDEDRSSDYIEQGKFYYETEVKPKYEKKNS